MFEYNEGKIMMINKIFEEIREERERQDKKWGVQRHHPYLWNTILGEEKGEVDKATLDFFNSEGSFEDIEMELIQTAAVCVSYLESIRSEKQKYLSMIDKATSNYLQKVIAEIKSKHGIDQLHVLKLNQEYIYPIITGKKETEIRKMNKSYILPHQHVLFVDPEFEVPLLLVYIESAKIYELLASEMANQTTTNGIQLISRMLNDGIKIDRKTRDFVRQNYYDETALIVFKIKSLTNFRK